MDGVKFQEMSNFSHMTMHQQYANYSAFQPASASSSFESYYGSSSQSKAEEQEEAQLSYNQPIYSLPQSSNYLPPTSARTTTPSPATAAAAALKKRAATKKQNRNQYTKEQKQALENSYMDGAYVSVRRREEMAKELNLTTKQVKVWYQNRRQKDKRREQKLMKQQPQQVPVIKVPTSADSPDSGVQDLLNESHYQRHMIRYEKYSPEKYSHHFLPQYQKQQRSSGHAPKAAVNVEQTGQDHHQGQQQQQQQVKEEPQIVGYSETVTNKVDPVQVKAEEGVYDHHQQQHLQQSYDDRYYSYASAAAAAASAAHYSQYDLSQAFANYYNNYDYLQQYQYYQLMSGYQSQYNTTSASTSTNNTSTDSINSSADPQDPQQTTNYSGGY